MAFRRTRTKIVSPYTETAADRQRSALELKALSQSIREMRKQRGMTQAELGIAIGTEQAAIARLESGRHAPSFRTLQAIARATRAELDLFYRPLDPTVMEMRPPMTDTLSRPGFSTNRRHFLGGAMGLAGMLGLGKIRQVSAQEATAAAESAQDYVWTPPQWDPEPALFTVLDRNDQMVTVETIDGLIGAPANPQRLVSLSWEYVSLFELGVTDPLIAVTAVSHDNEIPLYSAGDLTSAMHDAFSDVTIIPDPWELDIEQVIALEPDLILASPYIIDDPEVLSNVAPVIRSNTAASEVPRSSARDYGELFGKSDEADQLIIEHEEYIARARAAVASAAPGIKAISLFPSANGDVVWVYTAYRHTDEGIYSSPEGPYQLYRELGITPSSVVEQLADVDRTVQSVQFSMEQIGTIDADYIFAWDSNGSSEGFITNPIVQQTEAGKQNRVIPFDASNFGYGLAAMRASVAWMVEQITGEPLE